MNKLQNRKGVGHMEYMILIERTALQPLDGSFCIRNICHHDKRRCYSRLSFSEYSVKDKWLILDRTYWNVTDNPDRSSRKSDGQRSPSPCYHDHKHVEARSKGWETEDRDNPKRLTVDRDIMNVY